jgi:hypothetical protein
MCLNYLKMKSRNALQVMFQKVTHLKMLFLEWS